MTSDLTLKDGFQYNLEISRGESIDFSFGVDDGGSLSIEFCRWFGMLSVMVGRLMYYPMMPEKKWQ